MYNNLFRKIKHIPVVYRKWFLLGYCFSQQNFKSIFHEMFDITNPDSSTRYYDHSFICSGLNNQRVGLNYAPDSPNKTVFN